jgi:predicted transcriptional regulator
MLLNSERKQDYVNMLVKKAIQKEDEGARIKEIMSKRKGKNENFFLTAHHCLG